MNRVYTASLLIKAANISYQTSNGKIDEIVEADNADASFDTLVRVLEAVDGGAFPSKEQPLVYKQLAANPTIKDYPEVRKKLAESGDIDGLWRLAANPALKDRKP